jgi:geranylgeranyl diphosphate synthase, type II
MRSPDELRSTFEEHLADLQISPALGGLEEAVRYALQGGGKRIRPVLCLATTQAAGGIVEEALDAAAAIELIHSFSLVHDDLPAQAILAGDALLNEAFALALRYSTPEVGREVALATSEMIGGQSLDVNGGSQDHVALNRLKTGRLFEACVGCALWVAEVPVDEQAPWRAFGADFGFLFQAVDDLLDDDGLVRERGREETFELATETEERARGRLDAIDADTSVLAGLLTELGARKET